jgi:cation:H+ antiporter
LIICLLIFVAYCVATARHAPSASGLSIIGSQNYNLWKRDVFLIVLGIFCLGGGAELMVRGAVMIATILGISEVVIGLSIVAVGTSLPELAASMVSAWKGEMDISIGNVIGSNIFNVLFVLGICPMLRALEIEARVLEVDFPIMLGFCVLLLALLLFVSPRLELDRKKGLMLLMAYLLFLIGLF